MDKNIGITWIVVKALYDWSANYSEWPPEVDNRMGYYVGGVQGVYAVNIAEEISGFHL